MELPFSPLFWLVGAVLGIGFFQRQIQFLRRQPGDHIITERYQFADAFMIGGTVLFLLISIAAAVESPGQVVTTAGIIQSAVFYLVILLGLLSFLIVRGLSPLELFGLRRSGAGHYFLLGLGGLILCYPLIFLAQLISYEIAGHPPPQPIVLFLLGAESWTDRLAVIFVAVLVAPLVEEFIFRGYLFGVLQKWTGRWWALGLTSFVFAGIHGHLPSFAGLFVLGLFLGVLYLRSGSLWIPIAIHAVFNAISVLMAVFWPEMVQ
jgi:membrane protease YdiL (CAAX protease family)